MRWFLLKDVECPECLTIIAIPALVSDENKLNSWGRYYTAATFIHDISSLLERLRIEPMHTTINTMCYRYPNLLRSWARPFIEPTVNECNSRVCLHRIWSINVERKLRRRKWQHVLTFEYGGTYLHMNRLGSVRSIVLADTLQKLSAMRMRVYMEREKTI